MSMPVPAEFRIKEPKSFTSKIINIKKQAQVPPEIKEFTESLQKKGGLTRASEQKAQLREVTETLAKRVATMSQKYTQYMTEALKKVKIK